MNVTVSPVRTVRVMPRDVRMSSVELTDRESTFESDTHADTCCLGKGALEIYDHMQPVNVHGYDHTLGVQSYRTISGVLGYDHPYDGTRYHLVIHQAVSIPRMDHHLFNPMQARVNGVEVNDVPRFLTINPTDETYSIVAQDEYGERVCLPFSLNGVVSYLTTSSVS